MYAFYRTFFKETWRHFSQKTGFFQKKNGFNSKENLVLVTLTERERYFLAKEVHCVNYGNFTTVSVKFWENLHFHKVCTTEN